LLQGQDVEINIEDEDVVEMNSKSNSAETNSKSNSTETNKKAKKTKKSEEDTGSEVTSVIKKKATRKKKVLIGDINEE
jgi:hypothetical protein